MDEFLSPFLGNELEMFKSSVNELILKIRYNQNVIEKCTKKCWSHKKKFKKTNNYFLCSTSIKEIEKIIYEN